jgi:leader peptidase (prepilin peptidase)/N-methyltransferase
MPGLAVRSKNQADLTRPIENHRDFVLPKRRPRIRYLLWQACAAVVLLGAAYIFGISYLQAQSHSQLAPADLYLPRTVDVVIVVWSFWVASSIGSFLNVVAWRMPRGESINGRSHCPRCFCQLKARDNFPVFGWLALRGRCRTCRLPISPRYPIVEGVVGLSLTGIAVSEVYRFSLPRQDSGYGGPLWLPEIDHQILLILLYHVMGLTMCWAFGLIRMDGNRLPGRLVVFALTVTVLPLLIYPALMVVPWQMDVSDTWQPDGRYVDSIIRVITALVAATALGRYLARGFCPTADPKLDPLGKSTVRLVDLISILAIPTLLVGWQASPAVIVLAAVLAFWLRPLLPLNCDALGRFAISMPFAATFQIVFWRRLESVESVPGEGFPLWPSEGTSPGVMWFWLLMLGIVPLWLREPSLDTDAGTDDLKPSEGDLVQPDSSGDATTTEDLTTVREQSGAAWRLNDESEGGTLDDDGPPEKNGEQGSKPEI